MPFIVARLNEMRKKHNILLVTNDHVNTLKKMADNTVTVSAIDRGKVMINGKKGVDRQLALLAMSIGDEYKPTVNNSDLQFFISTEFSKHGGKILRDFLIVTHVSRCSLIFANASCFSQGF